MKIFGYLKSNKNLNKIKGMTLVETLMVLVIIVVISTISMNSYYNQREKQALQKEVDSIVSIIEKMKNQSANSNNSDMYGVTFASSTVTTFSLHNGGNGMRKKSILVYNLEKPVTISNISLSNHGKDINYFSRITGTPSTTGTIVVSTKSYSKIVTIYGTGIIEAK